MWVDYLDKYATCNVMAVWVLFTLSSPKDPLKNDYLYINVFIYFLFTVDFCLDPFNIYFY